MYFDEDLRYLPTQDVDNVSDSSSLTVESADGADLGHLDGFMVDPERQALRYYVVSRIDTWGKRLGFVPFVPGCLDSEHGVLRLLDNAATQPLG